MRMRQLMLLLILITGLTLSIASPLYAAPPAQGGDTGPAQDGGDGGGDTGNNNGATDGGIAGKIGDALSNIGGATSAIVNNITRHILVFPVSSMQKAVEMILGGLLKGSASSMAQPFYDILGATVLSSPGIRQAGTGIWQGVDIFVPTWNFTMSIAVALWPAVLALMMMVASKNIILAADWGIGDFKEIFSNWVIGAIMSGASLYIADIANRGSNALTNAILGGSINVAAGSNIDILINALTIGTLEALSSAVPLAGILLGFILLSLGFTLLMTLVFQYVARFALLYILVSLLPIVFILGILPPLRWLQWMFVRGLGMVLLLGPINALLLKMSGAVMVSAIISATGPGAPVIRFVMAAGIVSVLLTIDFTIIKGVFGAVGMVVNKSMGMAKGAVTAAATVATAGAVGAGAAGASLGAGGGGAGAAGASLGGGGGGGLGGGGFNLSALKSGLNNASATERQNAIGAGMSAAGRVLSSGGAGSGGRLLGSAMQGMGQANSQAAQRTEWQEQQAQRQEQQAQRQMQQAQRQMQQDQRQTQRADDQAWQKGEGLVQRQHRKAATPAAMHRASSEARQSVNKARQGGQSMENMAKQSGYTGAGATDRFVAGRIESRLASSGQLKGARAFTPDRQPGVPQPKDTPDLWDFDRGQQLSDMLGMGERGGTPMALLYHGLRSGATNPTEGNQAAEGFYQAVGNIDMSQEQSDIMNAARQSFESYGKQAGLSDSQINQIKSRIK